MKVSIQIVAADESGLNRVTHEFIDGKYYQQ